MKSSTFLAPMFLLLAPHAVLHATDANPTKPNIVVFLVDDMGVMDTSVPFLTDESGKPKRYPLNDYYRTPNMERLAARGIRFNNFYAMSVCSPTRISHHDRAERRAASHDELDQSRQGQPRSLRSAGVELEGLEARRRDVAAVAASSRLSHDPRRQGPLWTARV